jgi:imidazolonepropionase-like amidohydrolase
MSDTVQLALRCLLFTLILSPLVVAQQKLAITHVSVIDATGAPAQPDMTVVIDRGRMIQLGKAGRVRVPRDARVVDGRNKFLIPGLWDMHAHIGEEEIDRNVLLSLFVANGVTGIRVMSGDPKHLLWRREIELGELLGPQMVVAFGPLENEATTTEAQALEAVRKAKQGGSDFFKVHDNLPRLSYFALMDEANRLGVRVEGHVPLSVTLAEASNAGQKSIEHFTGLTEAETNNTKADELSEVLLKKHTWHCPTLIMRNNYAVLDDKSLLNDPRLSYAKPSWKKWWLPMVTGSGSMPADEWMRRKETVRREKALVGRFHAAGVSLLAGSDDNNPFVFPGFSLHDELALLVDSGLTPMQALQTATLNPARFLNRLAAAGTIKKGKLANLILLDANPLEEIHNTTKINAVVVNGQLLDRNALDALLASAKTALAARE